MATDGPNLLAELAWRGMLQDQTDGLADRLERGPISAYNGFDPSGPSLHAGSLVPIMGLVHLQRAGGRPVVVVGGGTGMIGDPSGKSAERNLLDEETIEANTASIRRQLERFLDFSPGPAGALMVDNRTWLGRYGLLEYLRDIGKHFTVSYMLAKDSVQTRLGAGMSFTEFSYMTLQAADFLHLYREHGVEAQTGGADQWGNITAGLELIRRAEGMLPDGSARAFAWSFPLLLDSGGAKFGKTEKGAVYLDPSMTTPYAFYQFWFNQPDDAAGGLLRRMTTLPRDRIELLEADSASAAHERVAQRALAYDLTARVHGDDEARRQVRVSEAAFGRGELLDPEVLEVLYDNLEHFEISTDGSNGPPDALAVAIASGLFASNSEARRAISQNSLTINDARIARPDDPVPALVGSRYLVVRAGKKRLAIGRRPT